jgi:hypothetical protein
MAILAEYCNKCLKPSETCSCERQPQVAKIVDNHERTATACEAQIQEAKHKITQISNRDNERQSEWWRAGVSARGKYGRHSPFYENATADYFFFCGYDGTKFEEAQQFLREKIQQTLEQDSTLLQSVNELTQSS